MMSVHAARRESVSRAGCGRDIGAFESDRLFGNDFYPQ
jgi:hypothetical protein